MKSGAWACEEGECATNGEPIREDGVGRYRGLSCLWESRGGSGGGLLEGWMLRVMIGLGWMGEWGGGRDSRWMEVDGEFCIDHM